MYFTLFALTISFLTAYFFLPVIIRIAQVKQLYDAPDERKIHTKPISSLGGVGIFAGFILALMLSFSLTGAPELQYYAAAGLVIFFLGLKDDILVIKPLRKLIGQLFAAGILVHMAGVRLDHMYGFLGIDALPESLGILLSYFTIVLIINACNLIDGIDGLAGLLGATVSLALGCYFLYCGQERLTVLSFSLTGSLVAFLLFNMHPAKIFMGDCGSMLIGLILSILVIRFINYAPTSTVLPIPPSPVVGFSFLMIPLMDTLRVFAIRILQGRSPFSPDRNHVHHLLMRLNWTHRQIALRLALVNTLFVALGFAISEVDVTLLFLIMLGLFFLAMGFISREVVQNSATKEASVPVSVPAHNEAGLNYLSNELVREND